MSNHQNNKDTVLICGYGTVGKSAQNVVGDTYKTIVVDTEDKEGVDIVGDITNPETFNQIQFENISSVIISTNNDTTNIYTTLILSHRSENIKIISRAEKIENISKMYQSGANRVLSLEDVNGEYLASILIDNEDFFTPNVDFNFENFEATAFDGLTLEESRIGKETGCRVAVIIRNNKVLSNIDKDTELKKDDSIVVVGKDDEINHLRQYIDEFTA